MCQTKTLWWISRVSEAAIRHTIVVFGRTIPNWCSEKLQKHWRKTTIVEAAPLQERDLLQLPTAPYISNEHVKISKEAFDLFYA